MERKGPRTLIRPNELLAALPAREREHLAPHLEPVDVPVGTVLQEPGTPQAWAWFPAGCVVSKLYVMCDGATSAVGLIGREGVVGLSLYMGGGRPSSLAVVQSAGPAFRIRGDILRREFDADGVLRQSMLRYAEGLLVQSGRTAACNRHHIVEQQVCRWLLMLMDRLASRDVAITQELMARMLGVRREGVTEAAGKLQRARIIRYSRGRITVLDRRRMQAASCECYDALRSELSRLLPWSLTIQGYDPGSRRG